MDNISKVKRLLNQINRKCDTEGKSIFSVLEGKNTDIIHFLNAIGFNCNLLNRTGEEALDNLLRTLDARFTFNPSMESLLHDEIGIFSKSLNMYFGFLDNLAKFSWDKESSSDEISFNECEYMASRLKEGALETIHFSCKTRYQSKLAKERIISNSFPLDHAEISIEHFGQSEEKASITINSELLQSDLNNIIRLLYNFNYNLAYAILYFYPATMKVINHDFTMNNFNNR